MWLMLICGGGLALAAGRAVRSDNERAGRTPLTNAAPDEPRRRRDRSDRPTAAVANAPPGERYRIEYGDAFGEITTRTIVVLGIAEEPATGAIYLRSFCLLRGADRTFRADRVLRAVRERDGMTVVDPTSHFRALASGIAGGMQWWGGRSPEQVTDDAEHARVIARARSGLNGLIWLAAADGEVSEAEIAVMFEWIEFRAAAARDGRCRWDREAARGWIRNARPTLSDIRAGLGRMGKAESAEFRSSLEALAAADGVVDRLERGRIDQIVACLP